ncbi:hypothetical protein VM95_25350 [Streptomyces rubellomurinus]|uniref:Streptomyces killer toxin-like beta/gamma crystallin domain-containing protein n=2 Tax=Streptomyces TaxID=1883 RepID=A0A0F2TBM1_STRR3|nr:hypothetical protein VM95_25350 [Streptomyces rubellomurinus]
MAICAGIMAASPAAADCVSISGTCPNNGGWYTSSNVRYVSGFLNYIGASFNSFPDGMQFYIIDSHGTSHGVINASSSFQYLSWGDVWVGESFQNRYGNAGYDWAGYSFSGQETY